MAAEGQLASRHLSAADRVAVKLVTDRIAGCRLIHSDLQSSGKDILQNP